MAPVVAVDNLSFSYGTAPVLQELDLSVNAGEVVCLLGPNGVGKTTLVENLLGSLAPTSGSIRVLGTDPRRAGADFWARVGLVQQNWTDHAKWRVADQLEWIRAIQLTASPSAMGVTEVLDAVGLADKATSRLSRLSGGQRRAIDFAAALMGRPELLVMDEPTTGLDPVSKAHLHDLILQRVDDDNATILMTTHDLAEAERLASRILIMSRGRIIADGSVTALREQLGHDAEVTWIQDGERHVHTTATPEHFLTRLDLGTITGLTITRPTLEETYLSLVGKEHEEQQS
ncbi:ABC transporter ATP-binding protein [Actinomyces massiliensis]|uniref:ABC transporter, ATP-binding protein n=1 Tax=Actinomyces massiliensis F0489 TaxID=1125718 RepID=J1GV69_9ACTO|nr:ABC transporter ATP-binding protein [Actinomyces massiliensis]EJF36778.1 ABC transporter, ATP-binding protein [Actinomyces massiliensis F0489]WLD73107.1 ABC transporter ATP-binding protein [Actinomyces massiliensis]